ncbi:1583_t:CDS:1, partial [Paraglomus occultum]
MHKLLTAAQLDFITYSFIDGKRGVLASQTLTYLPFANVRRPPSLSRGSDDFYPYGATGFFVWPFSPHGAACMHMCKTTRSFKHLAGKAIYSTFKLQDNRKHLTLILNKESS